MNSFLDRGMYRARAVHKDVTTTFTAAGTTTDVIAAVTNKKIVVDRVWCSAGAAAVTVQLKDGATAMGPRLSVAANTSNGVDVILPYDHTTGVDITVTGGACVSYLDYHEVPKEGL